MNGQMQNPRFLGNRDAEQDALSYVSDEEIDTQTVAFGATLVRRYMDTYAPAAREVLLDSESYTNFGVETLLYDHAWDYAVSYIQTAWKKRSCMKALLLGFDTPKEEEKNDAAQ